MLGLRQEWFRALSFARLVCGVYDRLNIYPPVWGILLPLEQTPYRRDQQVIMYHPKDTGNEEQTNLPTFRIGAPTTELPHPTIDT